MLYFVPAWYQQNEWCESEQSWHTRRMRTEFDDTVKQIQLFHRSGAYPYQIMLLSFTPNFRHFLHRQSVYHAPYWSCFDAIQEIRRKKTMVLSFHNLKWPSDIEFIYSPFVVIAMRHGKKYAQIEFGEDGNPIQIDLFENEIICRRNIYDDRGFVSASIIYEEGKSFYQDYLMENGVWKMRWFHSDGHVEINPKCPDFLLIYQGKESVKRFSRLNYDSLEQVIYEVLLSYIRLTKDSDLFCVAAHERHAKLLLEVLRDRKMILSFFEDRYRIEDHSEAVDLVRRVDYIVTDSKEKSDYIKSQVKMPVYCISDITPYDSRVDFGISQQLNVQKILVPVDGISDETFGKMIGKLGEYLPTNENAQIHLFTRMADYGRERQLLEQTRKCLKEAGFEPRWADEKKTQVISENELEEQESVSIRFFVEQCVDELAVSKCMREQRIIVDMREIPELYLQITAISMGIPQIVRTGTQFIEDGKNGVVLRNMDNLSETLRFYLDGLANWNEAMVASYELGKKYTTKVLLDKWKEVIDCIG